MAHQTFHVSFLSAFADYVHHQRDAIGRRWMQPVRESPEVPGAMHIAHFCTDLLTKTFPQLFAQPVEREKRYALAYIEVRY